ncbi:acyl-CoA dehydratase activase-related protein [Natroniella sulfidigena]|uniref:acyl-CoA dehydratase activase-related protein n=1 Tax=Natroniella sulfidigena TaxID=723921 RepID=UPI00200B3931|nr:acyl-CoA dehydratase activase-related protein [Natroniella sulfidigena]MCK8816426.1 acyl-CoA dehydratase activase-related protein [Natroniella sulfidigena]
MVKIGIPKTLAYYVYFPLWKTFLEELGVKIILSDDTSREIIDAGVKETVNDACVPIKLFHGHVLNLKDRVDYLFIPRLVSLNGQTIYCPKFLGLPDMVASSLDDLPPILAPDIDLREGLLNLYKVIFKLGTKFTSNPLKIIKAAYKAKQDWKQFNQYLQAGYTAVEAMDKLNGAEIDLNEGDNDLKVAILGYPYIIYDPFVSVGMIQKLRELGVKVVTADMIPEPELEKNFKGLSKELFWTFSDQKIKAGLHYYEQADVDGIIHVTAFGCGPDFIVDKKLELEGKRRKDVSFMCLTIDEHTGEAGIVTRLEAYVDMLKLRSDRNESSLTVS